MTVRTPLYEAGHAARYERQDLIRQYQDDYDCRLVVMQDGLFSHSIQLFEETLFDADPRKDLHVILATQGGDGETALRLIRQAQSRCRELTVIVPDQAKSAGTLSSLLEPVTALMVQQARDQLGRTDDLVKEALACVAERTEEDVAALTEALKDPLIGEPKSRSTLS